MYDIFLIDCLVACLQVVDNISVTWLSTWKAVSNRVIDFSSCYLNWRLMIWLFSVSIARIYMQHLTGVKSLLVRLVWTTRCPIVYKVPCGLHHWKRLSFGRTALNIIQTNQDLHKRFAYSGAL